MGYVNIYYNSAAEVKSSTLNRIKVFFLLSSRKKDFGSIIHIKYCEKSPSVSLESSCLNRKGIVINQSVLPESQLSAVTLETAPAPAHKIEINLKVGGQFLMKLIFYETIIFEVLLNKTKVIYFMHSTKAAALVPMCCHTVEDLGVIHNAHFSTDSWVCYTFLNSKRDYQS